MGMEITMNAVKRTIKWEDNKVVMVDQRKLPERLEMLTCISHYEVIDAIKSMAIRGAPAIGVAAAYGMALAANNIKVKSKAEFCSKLAVVKDELAHSRPTAVNLFWALDEIWKVITSSKSSVDELKERILSKANSLAEQDIKTNLSIGENGVRLFEDGDIILTHCNAGSLATVFYGTAIGVIRSVFQKKRNIKVFVDETRPVLQGARLTAWELKYDKIPFTLICDSVAGFLMYQKKITKIVVGADRIVTNGDTVNKIGTYSLSVLAKVHNIPFYVAAPTSTIDFNLKKGEDIPIEERSPEEVTTIMDKRIAPCHIAVYNPAFDITPNYNITAIITENGILEPPYEKTLKSFLTK